MIKKILIGVVAALASTAAIAPTTAPAATPTDVNAMLEARSPGERGDAFLSNTKLARVAPLATAFSGSTKAGVTINVPSTGSLGGLIGGITQPILGPIFGGNTPVLGNLPIFGGGGYHGGGGHGWGHGGGGWGPGGWGPGKPPHGGGGNPPVSPVPEPSTWALMGVGLALTAFAVRRRQPSISVAYA